MSPAPARAASVSTYTADSCAGDIVCEKYQFGVPVPVTVVAGDPGEANRITITRLGDAWTVRDDGAPLRGCSPCPVTPGQGAIAGLHVNLGDGDDTLVLDTGGVTVVDGGPGSDTVTGGPENDVVDGGLGADHLTGGGGYDTLTFAVRRDPLRIGPGTDGEGDVFSGFGTIVGGSGADVLRGDGAPNVLEGGPGDDRLYGGAGDDRLSGDRGSDRLYGGPGDDSLDGDPEQGDGFYSAYFRMGADRLSGGPGDDLLSESGGGRNLFLGGPGADVMWLGTAPDRVRAGTGRDVIHARDGGRDAVDCGPGRDRVGADRRDALRHCSP